MGDQTVGQWVRSKRRGVTVNNRFLSLPKAISREPMPMRPSIFAPEMNGATAGNLRIGKVGDPSVPGKSASTGSPDTSVGP